MALIPNNACNAMFKDNVSNRHRHIEISNAHELTCVVEFEMFSFVTSDSTCCTVLEMSRLEYDELKELILSGTSDRSFREAIILCKLYTATHINH